MNGMLTLSVAAIALLLTVLQAYRPPLFELYRSSWGLADPMGGLSSRHL